MTEDSQEATDLIEVEAAHNGSRKPHERDAPVRYDKIIAPSMSSARASPVIDEIPVIATGSAADRKRARGDSVGASNSRSPVSHPAILIGEDLIKVFNGKVALDRISLTVRAGTFFGIVGPNGAGKTTTLSMITGLLRPDGGRVMVNGTDVWQDPAAAKRNIGMLPDRLRLFDRLTGAQLLFYSGTLRGLPAHTVRQRSLELARAFGFEPSLKRLVSDYSVGMTKKIALAAAMLHAPRLLVLDEPFESLDPVSVVLVTGVLRKYVSAGGTVILSSHTMELVERLCDDVAILAGGHVLDAGPMDRVCAAGTLEERFVQLVGGSTSAESLAWLHEYSD